MDRVEIRIANRPNELEKIVRLVDAFGAGARHPGPISNRLNLVLDEVLNNIVSYGYPDAAWARSGFASIATPPACAPRSKTMDPVRLARRRSRSTGVSRR